MKTRKAKRMAENPLSNENKEPLSEKIKSINAKGHENELRDYVKDVFLEKDYSSMTVEIGAFKTDVDIAKDFRDDCRKIMDTGLDLNPSYIFYLEDKFFDEYRKLKVLKLAECDDVEKVRLVLRGIHRAVNEMVRYLMRFSETGGSDVEVPNSHLEDLMIKVSDGLNQQSPDSEEWLLGAEVLRLRSGWEAAMKTGAVEEFSDMETILVDLAENYLEVINSKRSKESFSKQLKKAEQDISLLGELVKMRIKNKDTMKEDLELDSWQTVVKITLEKEKLET
ncbi:hypothetical protein IKG48_03320 [Candidatus Saccharibacteria bacterium]|nr:hypothetical protein [Candidatus Saccharibacteria bacterium]